MIEIIRHRSKITKTLKKINRITSKIGSYIIHVKQKHSDPLTVIYLSCYHHITDRKDERYRVEILLNDKTRIVTGKFHKGALLNLWKLY